MSFAGRVIIGWWMVATTWEVLYVCVCVCVLERGRESKARQGKARQWEGA